ncbi:hypothetical protein FRC11_001702, partial [Ceratobasidium sp. 423]
MEDPDQTVDTVMDTMEMMMPSSTRAENNAADHSMVNRLQSSQAMAEYQPLFEIYPMLAPPPAQWRDDILALSDVIAVTYLNGPDEDNTHGMCDQLPRLLNSMIQALSRISGAHIAARAVWFNYDDPVSLCAY